MTGADAQAQEIAERIADATFDSNTIGARQNPNWRMLVDRIAAALRERPAGYRHGAEDAASVATRYRDFADDLSSRGAADAIAAAIRALAPPAEVSLPMDRDTLGRMVREAWVRWAQQQPAPKPSWLLPYDELSEPDKEADRQIGETVAKWTLLHESARASLAPQEAVPKDIRGGYDQEIRKRKADALREQADAIESGKDRQS